MQYINNSFLLACGFTKDRYFDGRWQQFRIIYKIDGYDGQILVSPSPQTVGGMTPEEQVDKLSDMDTLAKHHIGDWQIFVNSVENHLTTFHYQEELIKLMKLCDTPLKYKAIDHSKNA